MFGALAHRTAVGVILAAVLFSFLGCEKSQKFEIAAYSATWCRECMADHAEYWRLENAGYRITVYDETNVDLGVSPIPLYVVRDSQHIYLQTHSFAELCLFFKVAPP